MKGWIKCLALFVGLTLHVAALAQSAFVSMVPVRLMDTHPGGATVDGQGSGGTPVSSERTLQVLTRAGIPASGVSAVALNVTVTEPGNFGFLLVWPTGTPQPLASNINYVLGLSISNEVIAKIGANGQVSIVSSGGSNVIVDVTGYFPTSSDLTPLPTPARLMDTRQGASTVDGHDAGEGAIGQGAIRDLQILGRDGGVVPNSVTAVILNVTATQPTGVPYITVWPSGTPQPNASNINLVAAGQTRANLVMVAPGSNGKISIYNSSGNTDVIVDIVGYFSSSSTFGSLVPARLLDTRTNMPTVDGAYSGGGALGSAGTLNLAVLGRGGVPNSGVGAVALNIIAVNPAATGYLVAWGTGTTAGNAPPPTMSFNFAASSTIASLVIAQVGSNGQVSINNGSAGATHVVADVVGWFPGGANPTTAACTTYVTPSSNWVLTIESATPNSKICLNPGTYTTTSPVRVPTGVSVFGAIGTSPTQYPTTKPATGATSSVANVVVQANTLFNGGIFTTYWTGTNSGGKTSGTNANNYFSGMTIQSNVARPYSTSTLTGIELLNCNGCTIDNVSFAHLSRFGASAYVTSSPVGLTANITVINCNFSDIGQDVTPRNAIPSLYVSGINPLVVGAETGVLWFTRNVVTGRDGTPTYTVNADGGVTIYGSRNIYVWNNTLTNVGFYSAGANGNHHGAYWNNTVTAAQEWAFDIVDGSNDITIANNTVTNTGFGAATLLNDSNVRIRNNAFVGNNRWGYAACSGVNVSGTSKSTGSLNSISGNTADIGPEACDGDNDTAVVPISTPRIIASPEVAFIPSGQATSSTMTWNAPGLSSVGIMVSQDGGTPSVMSPGGTTGSVTAPWILGGHTYNFLLTPYGSSSAIAQDLVTAIVIPSSMQIKSLNSNKCVDVYGGYFTNGTLIQQLTCNGLGQQNWTLIPDGQYFLISNLGTGSVMEVSGGSITDGAAIDQWVQNGTPQQDWILVPIGFSGFANNRAFQLVNRISGKCLDVTGGSNADNVFLQQWACNGYSQQTWLLGQ